MDHPDPVSFEITSHHITSFKPGSYSGFYDLQEIHMSKMTNITGISLPLAVWLANDDYDFVPGDKSISATALLKSTRQILLGERLTSEVRQTPDVADRIASSFGTAIHDSIERVWSDPKKIVRALEKLNLPKQVTENIRINPGDLEEGEIPIWLEQRGSREIMGYTISGKFDMVVDGDLHDFKTTSVYSYLSGNKDEDYSLQGSIYRWIHHDKITSDTIKIEFMFTDWQGAQAKQNSDYPQQKLHQHSVPLLSLKETEKWIIKKLRHLEQYASVDEKLIPECTDVELWRSSPVYKYYADPAKASLPNSRSTKNFDNLMEANAFRASKGKGIVVTVPGQVKACAYCQSAPICTQKDQYNYA